MVDVNPRHEVFVAAVELVGRLLLRKQLPAHAVAVFPQRNGFEVRGIRLSVDARNLVPERRAQVGVIDDVQYAVAQKIYPEGDGSELIFLNQRDRAWKWLDPTGRRTVVLHYTPI